MYCEENMSLIKEAIKILKVNGKFIGTSMISTDEIEQPFFFIRLFYTVMGLPFQWNFPRNAKPFSRVRFVR